MEYIDIKNGYTNEEVIKLAKDLKEGKVVIFPTDTVYGIVAYSGNEEAVKRIYDLKGRNYSKPMNVLVSNLDMIKTIVKNVTKTEEKIIKEFFPGALTIIFAKKDKFSNIITANLDTVGVRIPDNRLLIDIIDYIGEPIVATSSNLSGEEDIVNAQEAMEKFKDKVDCIVDGGISKGGKPSTIIRLYGNDINILREGPISRKEIEKIC